MVSQWIYFLILDVLSEVHIIERNVFHILPSAIIWVFVLLLVFLFTGFTRTTVTANLTCACWSRHLPDYLSSIVCCFKLKQSRQLQDESGSTQNALKQTLDGSLAPRLIESWVSLCERWAERVITSWYYGEKSKFLSRQFSLYRESISLDPAKRERSPAADSGKYRELLAG